MRSNERGSDVSRRTTPPATLVVSAVDSPGTGDDVPFCRPCPQALVVEDKQDPLSEYEGRREPPVLRSDRLRPQCFCSVVASPLIRPYPGEPREDGCHAELFNE